MKACNLCLGQETLIKKSHIYPEFLYKELFDDKHKLRRFTIADLKSKNLNVKRPSSGVYEGNLFCKKCETVTISGYETYIADILSGKNKKVQIKRIQTGELESLEITNIDYKKFKNFILSILFKAHVSTFPEFNDVSLGMYHEKIRNIVLNNEETLDLDFQINILKLEKDSNFGEIIAQPIRSKIDAETCYTFLIKGFLIVLNIKENRVSRKMKEMRLKSDGSILIPIIPKNAERRIIFTYFNLDTEQL